jgi:hypothetical protein
MAKQEESASCRYGTKFHLWKSASTGVPSGAGSTLPGGRDQACLTFTKKPLSLFSDILP